MNGGIVIDPEGKRIVAREEDQSLQGDAFRNEYSVYGGVNPADIGVDFGGMGDAAREAIDHGLLEVRDQMAIAGAAIDQATLKAVDIDLPLADKAAKMIQAVNGRARISADEFEELISHLNQRTPTENRRILDAVSSLDGPEYQGVSYDSFIASARALAKSSDSGVSFDQGRRFFEALSKNDPSLSPSTRLLEDSLEQLLAEAERQDKGEMNPEVLRGIMAQLYSYSEQDAQAAFNSLPASRRHDHFRSLVRDLAESGRITGDEETLLAYLYGDARPKDLLSAVNSMLESKDDTRVAEHLSWLLESVPGLEASMNGAYLQLDASERGDHPSFRSAFTQDKELAERTVRQRKDEELRRQTYRAIPLDQRIGQVERSLAATLEQLNRLEAHADGSAVLSAEERKRTGDHFQAAKKMLLDLLATTDRSSFPELTKQLDKDQEGSFAQSVQELYYRRVGPKALEGIIDAADEDLDVSGKIFVLGRSEKMPIAMFLIANSGPIKLDPETRHQYDIQDQTSASPGGNN